ncbi:MAG: hypothetical protein WA694_13845, partial [Pseudolabrys sp.]
AQLRSACRPLGRTRSAAKYAWNKAMSTNEDPRKKTDFSRRNILLAGTTFAAASAFGASAQALSPADRRDLA